MKKIILLFLVPLMGFAQYKNVEIATAKGICEPSISINCKDPANIVGGAVLNYVFYSQDSGKTWYTDTLKSTYGVWGDPCVVSDYAGNQYFFHLSDPTGTNWASEEILDRIVCQKTNDGGKTWDGGAYLGYNPPKDQDKQWVAVDPKTTNLYCTWTQFDKYGSKDTADHSNILFAMSADQGKNWSEPIRVNHIFGDCLDGDSTTEGAVPTVSPDGEIYVSWALSDKIYFNKSKDGIHWLNKDIVIARQPDGWDIDVPGIMRANGMPVTVCDRSNGPYRGTIYVNWVDKRRENYDVWFSRSSDRGKTWSKPQRINDDKGKADQFFTWMSCDPVTGYLYTVFYDRRNLEGVQTDVYLAFSKDGGRHWINEKISESPFSPDPTTFFGDYNNIDAFNGMVRPIWTRMDKEGKLSIWTALIELGNK